MRVYFLIVALVIMKVVAWIMFTIGAFAEWLGEKAFRTGHHWLVTLPTISSVWESRKMGKTAEELSDRGADRNCSSPN